MNAAPTKGTIAMSLGQKVVLSFNGYWESNWEHVSNQVMGFLPLVQLTHDLSWDLHSVSVVL
jgi:hypothetical protein